MQRTESRVRVRYKETDQMGIAHHANYLAWFEIGRTDLCRVTGITYREIEERGFLLVVTEITCRYRVPYSYDDEVIIETYVAEAGRRMLKFGYDLRRAGGDVLHANGSSTHIWVDRKTRKPTKAPEEIVSAFRTFVNR